ncbi:MAG: HEPN domain-containing protein [Acidobacteriia bacterium]|nr:HEPN domain-containing protein [Terriglobia bacterium]
MREADLEYLKAFLVSRAAAFPKTHDIRQLLYPVEAVAPNLAAELRDLDMLTPYAVEVRYMDDLPPLPPGQELELLALAGRARDAIRAELSGFLD